MVTEAVFFRDVVSNAPSQLEASAVVFGRVIWKTPRLENRNVPILPPAFCEIFSARVRPSCVAAAIISTFKSPSFV